MQPEAIGDMKKAGRASTKSFGDDSFRTYIARKISLQREQFGVLLPPPPPSPSSTNGTTDQKIQQKQGPRLPTSPPSLVRNRKYSPKQLENTHSLQAHNGGTLTNAGKSPSLPSSSSPMRVRFAPGSKPASTSLSSETKKRKASDRGMNKLIKRLKRKHGRRSRSSGKGDTSQEGQIPTGHSSRNPTEDDHVVRRSGSGKGDSSQEEQIPTGHSSNNPTVLTSNGAERSGLPTHMGISNDSTLEKAQISNSPRSSTKNRPDLFFLGVVVIVNGDTNPDAETLQRILHKHGGDLEKYETSRITHIIAEHLSFAKAKMYKEQRNPRPVVYPQWIIDSIKAQEQLPISQYLIREFLRDDEKVQPSLSSFLSVSQRAEKVTAKPALSEDPFTPKKGLAMGFQASSNSHVDESTINSPEPKELQSALKGESRLDDVVENNYKTTESVGEMAATLHDGVNSPKSPSVESDPNSRTDAKYINGRIRTVSTDPTFLDSFFQNSRLSYIGSFKQRKMKRKPSPKKAALDVDSVRLVFHVDMDCFFAAVVLRKFPQYQDRPVVISHFGKANGTQAEGSYKESTSECATCNYEARKYGIKKGMFLGKVKELCPDVVVLKYDFEGYQEVSAVMSDILESTANRYAGVVEEISCDEAYMELGFNSTDENQLYEMAAKVAESTRTTIFESTQCTATVGVAKNKFLAKLATDKVKPNGSFVTRDYRELLRPLKLRDLHGIGYRSEPKLRDAGLVTVEDVWNSRDSCGVLQKVLGEQLGKKIYHFCEGQDDRPVVECAERKTIGAECNYGVRFNGELGVDYMIVGLAKEVEKRMNAVGVKGAKVTLKLKQRKPNAPPPPKFLGHGSCFNISKSMDINSGITRDHMIFAKIGLRLFSQMKVDVDDVRGMGIVISNLTEDSAEDTGIRKFFCSSVPQKPIGALPRSSSADFKTDKFELSDPEEVADAITKDDCTSSLVDEPPIDFELPPLSQIHMSQVEELPSPMRRQVHQKMKEDNSLENAKSHSHGKKAPVARRGILSLFDTAASRSDSHQNTQAATTTTHHETCEEPRSGDASTDYSMDFYRDNLLPLTEYLDQNMPSDESIAYVTGFFNQLIEDNWLSHVNGLMKAMKRRKDEWSQAAWESLHVTITTRLSSQMDLR